MEGPKDIGSRRGADFAQNYEEFEEGFRVRVVVGHLLALVNGDEWRKEYSKGFVESARSLIEVDELIVGIEMMEMANEELEKFLESIVKSY